MIQPEYCLKRTKKHRKEGRQEGNNNEKCVLGGMHLQELEFFISPLDKKLHYAISSLPFS